ncbi:hypothetical protein ACHAW5_003406 [Stephanodiscus triporus]|uniref:HSF-type DNA-binding domain-containing protein n=1 Tax=Stephanodiscus triporus TaxID=2934178 RepID=A0ABD3PE93_9STRA
MIFYYIDHSRDVDDDPLSPLSPALSVPNFVIKLHAILICESLSDVIAWMPHGRSWKILNQTEFDRQVLPTYFNQGNVSSFYRQANGWGFRRMLKGPDKGSFYNERFIRGLPFLAKKMKRIGGAKIVDDINISHEPILWKISEERPTPAGLARDSLDYIVLDSINKCIQKGGPKAKMPFVHNLETFTYAKKDATELAIGAGVATDLSTPHGGMIDDSSSTADRRATTLREALLQQHQGLLHGHQVYNDQLEQQSHMRQPLSQNQNQQVNNLLLKLMLNRNQAATTLDPQQHQAWPQHQFQTATPTANIAHIISNAGQFPNAHILTAPPPVAEPPLLQGNIGNASSIASLLGLQQAGNNASGPLTSTNENIDALRWLYLLQSNQGQGQHQTTLNPGTILNSVLQNVLQSQLQQPSMRPNVFQLYPHNQTTLRQTTYSPSNQQPYSIGNILANLASQPVQYNQQLQPYQLNQYSLPQQHQMTQPIPQQHHLMQQYDRQDQAGSASRSPPPGRRRGSEKE